MADPIVVSSGRQPTSAPAMDEAVLVLQHAWDLEARLKLRGYHCGDDEKDRRGCQPRCNRDVNGDGKTARNDAPGRLVLPKSGRTAGAHQHLQRRSRGSARSPCISTGTAPPDPRGYETWYTKQRSFGDRNYEFAALGLYVNSRSSSPTVGYEAPEEERGVLPDTTANVDNEHSILDHFVITGPECSAKTRSSASKMPGAIVEALCSSRMTTTRPFSPAPSVGRRSSAPMRTRSSTISMSIRRGNESSVLRSAVAD